MILMKLILRYYIPIAILNVAKCDFHCGNCYMHPKMKPEWHRLIVK